MERTDDRFLPVLLLGAQAVVWPGFALARGAAPPAADLLAAALAGALVAVALAARRRRPVPVLMLVAVVCAVGAGPLPAGAMVVLGTAGVALAIFTVATERDTTTALLCVATLSVWQLMYSLSLHGLEDRQGLDLVLTALLYATATGTGLFARRRRADRSAAERRLHRARGERHRLPAAEQRRMERELHDVSAHHLTAVVVTVEAALGLRDRRPELADKAVEFAAETGREVTRALSAVRAPTPSPEDLPAPEERLRELVTGFRALGLSVTCETEALPDDAIGDAAYGIVREALTNVVRHASGAPTTVRCVYGDTSTDIVVRNAPPAAPGVGAVSGSGSGKGLGGGRGQSSLRGRAREAGGTLSSGPTPDGGWEVRAVLPGRHRTVPRTSVPRDYRLAQFVAAALCFQPLLPFLIVRAGTTSTEPGVSAGALFALLATAQVFTLLWLRRSPRIALGRVAKVAPSARRAGPTASGACDRKADDRRCGWPGRTRMPSRTLSTRRVRVPGVVGQAGLSQHALGVLLVLAGLWPAAMAVSGYAGPVLLPPGLGVLATCVALAMAAAGTPEAGTVGSADPSGSNRAVAARRWALLAPAVAVHVAAAIAAVLARGATAPAWEFIGAAIAMTVPTFAAWSFGVRYGKRRRADRERHQDRLATWMEEAVRDAWAERRRITAGLETTVLARTAELVEEAEAGRLVQTAERAREALTAMRALLETVHTAEPPTELRPQPTLQALDLLVNQCRATGRQVEVRLTDRVPRRLPAEVDIAAYRVAETILQAGGDEPAVLVLDATDRVLTLTATGVSGAGHAARERLMTRAGALGGTLTTEQPGTVLLRLPLSTVPSDGATTREDSR
ncbi:histidine kinase [Streptomyces sp. NBC_01511]|uniref:sensor histidine kinase n=1 Tax=Streptomyces sp. NBC_01511 TaxID=2903889 RepID=UPI00386F957A